MEKSLQSVKAGEQQLKTLLFWLVDESNFKKEKTNQSHYDLCSKNYQVPKKFLLLYLKYKAALTNVQTQTNN